MNVLDAVRSAVRGGARAPALAAEAPSAGDVFVASTPPPVLMPRPVPDPVKSARSDAAARLAKAVSIHSGLAQAESIEGALAGADLDAPTLRLLGQVADKVTGWQFEGRFHRTPDDGIWTDQVDGAPARQRDSRMCSRPIALDDWSDCTLQYTEGHAFERGDGGALEIQLDGQEWVSLQPFMRHHEMMSKFADLSACDGHNVRFRFVTTRAEADSRGGLFVGDFVVEGLNHRTGKRESLPLEALMRLMSVNDLTALATEPSLSLAQRREALETLNDVPDGWMERLLDAVRAARTENRMASLDLGQAAAGAASVLFGRTVDDAVSRASRPEAKVQVGEQELVIGGVRIPKRAG